MSLQNAFGFINSIRTNKKLQKEVEKMLQTEEGLSGLLSLSENAFTIEELQNAFRQDWILRWLSSESSL